MMSFLFLPSTSPGKMTEREVFKSRNFVLAVLDEHVSVCPSKMRMNRQVMCNAYTFLNHTSLKIITRKKNQNMVVCQRRRNNNRSEFK